MNSQTTILKNIHKHFNNVGYVKVKLFDSDSFEDNETDFISLNYFPFDDKKVFLQLNSYKKQGNLRVKIYGKEPIDVLHYVDLIRDDISRKEIEGVYYSEEQPGGQIYRDDNGEKFSTFLDFTVCLV